MRTSAIIGLALSVLASTAAATEAPNARAAYVERRGLIEADARCRLFTPSIRAALEAGAGQARGALLRAGWSTAQVRELDGAVASAARTRACTDPRTAEAAADARTAYTSWANASSMQFPGWERTWIARRVVRADGWRLSQSLDAGAMFGVRDHEGAQNLVLVLPVARGQTAPTSVQLQMRDSARSSLTEVSLTQRVAYGLAAGAPTTRTAQSYASRRVIERVSGGSQAVFVFPDAAFRDLLTLDPRESLELRIAARGGEQRIYVEVGDVAAARAFLTIR